ncbi:hypothetical protein [Candidatus Palauibacter sp.]|uniref:hypothetical protein n=1 Tax=Candidatus Palauibacter sp. TaxID=3101350 RepID=UPI003B59B496
MIAHLKGREKALEAFGWTGAKAEWIALVCLHSGVFTRAQLLESLRVHRGTVRRFVRALTTRRLAAEEMFEGHKVCRVHARSLYRALGAEHIRHRRSASTQVLTRRLLSLDYVIEHTGLPWLPTEDEKVAAFEGLGLDRALLPAKVYGTGGTTTRRHFPVKLPIAMDSGSALFVYVDPGHDTSTALRSWGAAHRGLWEAIRERGRSVEVVAVGRRRRETQRARRVMRGWAEDTGPALPVAAIREEIARIKQAVRGMDEALVEKLGGLQGCLVRIVELEDRLASARPGKAIDGFATWRSSRIPGGMV